MNAYKKIGIGEYVTKTAGVGGKVKEKPEDFVVQEVALDGTVASLEPKQEVITSDAEYTHFTLVKTDWNQAQILKRISRRCGVSIKRFSGAGTKDKFAITAQRISAWRIKPEQLYNIHIKDCKLGDFSPADKKFELGDLKGNQFTVLVRDVKNPENIEKFLQEINEAGSFPNFFGPQRFGIRLNNHLVGKSLLNADFESAVKIFLAGTIENEREEGKKAREALAENWGDFKEALKLFPVYMRFERALLDRLNRYPNDFVGAFKQLPKNTYKIFTHAYQSYLFNILLSNKIKKKESLEGTGALIGYASELTDEELQLLTAEGFTQEQLRINAFPEASVRGSERKHLTKIKIFEHELIGNNLKLRFELEKGSYATIFLEELTKSKSY